MAATVFKFVILADSRVSPIMMFSLLLPDKVSLQERTKREDRRVGSENTYAVDAFDFPRSRRLREKMVFGAVRTS